MRDGEPFCYSADDDWWIDGDYRFTRSYSLSESCILPVPAKTTLRGEEWTAAINAMKEQITAGRALKISYYATNARPNEEVGTDYISPNWAHYTYDKTGTNHLVTIIGWDDNYPRENFAHKLKNGDDAPIPAGDGAWLVKNSWGSAENEFPNRGKGNWGLWQGQDKGVFNEETGKWEYNAADGAVQTGYSEQHGVHRGRCRYETYRNY